MDTQSNTKGEISYTINTKYKLLPVGSTLLAVASLVWLFFTEGRKSGYLTAMGLAIGFGLLAFIEFIIHWYKGTIYEGYTYTFSKEGIERRIGNTRKVKQWSDYQCFTTSFSAKFGKVFSFLPFSSLLFSDSDRYTINLYHNENMAISTAYDQIRILPENHEKVISYISQFLPCRRQHLHHGKFLNTILLLLIIFCLALIITVIILSI